MRQFPLGDAVSPVAEILERDAAEHLRQRVQHERRGLARLHAANPRPVRRLELAERGGGCPGGLLARLMAADAALFLTQRALRASGVGWWVLACHAERVG